MKHSWNHLCWALLSVTMLLPALVAQDSASLGDVARKTREQRRASPAKPVLTEDDIPRRSVLRQFYCLPVNRLEVPPRPCRHVEIDLNVRSRPSQGGGYHWFFHYSLYLKNGHEYRVSFWPDNSTSSDPNEALENAKRNYLAHIVHEEVESDFTTAAKILYAEDTAIEGGPAQLVAYQGASNRGLRRGIT